MGNIIEYVHAASVSEPIHLPEFSLLWAAAKRILGIHWNHFSSDIFLSL